MDHFHGIELAIILYEHICDDNNMTFIVTFKNRVGVNRVRLLMNHFINGTEVQRQ